MEKLKIQSTKATPQVEFDPKINILSIKGEIYPEKIDEFFTPIFEWLKRYVNNLHSKCIFAFHLQYFNTAGTGAISSILEILEKGYARGKDISVHWYFDPENDMMESIAEELREDITMPFQIIEKKL